MKEQTVKVDQIDVGSHEFTLAALKQLFEMGFAQGDVIISHGASLEVIFKNIVKTNKDISKLYRKNRGVNLRLFLTTCVAAWMFNNFNERIKKLEGANKEVSTTK